MLTLYSVVKGFENEFAHIQRNAVQSWLSVCPGTEIILFGPDEPGAAEEAERFGLPILPMERNVHGAPLLSSVIGQANALAHFDIRCLINADILLEPSFRSAVDTVAGAFDTFLLTMQRFNVQVDEPIDFSGDWHAQVCALERTAYAAGGVDVFCYRGNWLTGVPPFGIGRTSWDNWIVETAHQQNVPIVDGTQYTRAFHQNHSKVRVRAESKGNQAMLKQAFGKINVGKLGRATYALNNQGQVVKRGKR